MVGEGDIYAGIKATMQLAVKPSMGGAISIYDTTKGEGFGIWMSVKDAYIAGQDWKVSILGTKGAPDYAVSDLDGDYYEVVKDSFGTYYDYAWVPATYALNVWKDSAITVTYKGFTVAGGFQGDGDGDVNANIVDSKRDAWNAFNFFVETPAFEFDGGSAQVAAIVGSNGAKTEDKVLTVDGKKYNAYTNLDEVMVGVSAKASYAADAFSAAVALDVSEASNLLVSVSRLVAYSFATLIAFATEPSTVSPPLSIAMSFAILAAPVVSLSIQSAISLRVSNFSGASATTFAIAFLTL